MRKIIVFITTLFLLTAFLSACASSRVNSGSTALPILPVKVPASPAALPLPEIDVNNVFGVDKNINIDTIDSYLGRDDVAYIDVRMLFDPADFAAIGGEPDLTRTIQGFSVVPYPFIATLPRLPVSGAYDGPCLYTLTWDKNGNIASAAPNFKESVMILNELFPKDKAIFIMCGMGGYSGMMKSLLIHLGWDEKRLYNVGANWNYAGNYALELELSGDADGDKILATWRADYVYIDFPHLHRMAE